MGMDIDIIVDFQDKRDGTHSTLYSILTLFLFICPPRSVSPLWIAFVSARTSSFIWRRRGTCSEARGSLSSSWMASSFRCIAACAISAYEMPSHVAVQIRE